MKKIMFNDRYELTEAVLSGRKTQTRRIITCPKEFKGEYVAGFHVYKRQSDGAMLGWPSLYDADESTIDGGYILPKYKVGEVVAIVQSYKDVGYDPESPLMESNGIGGYVKTKFSPGWTNKMFVRADLMPHHIRITNVRVERLQEISDEDCLKEGIIHAWTGSDGVKIYHSPNAHERRGYVSAADPRYAFAFFIDRILGKGTWASNPYVFVYEFELIK